MVDKMSIKPNPTRWGWGDQWVVLQDDMTYPIGVSVGDADADFMSLEDAKTLYANLGAAIEAAEAAQEEST